MATNIAMIDTTTKTIALMPKAELNSTSKLRSAEVKTANSPSATVMPKTQRIDHTNDE